MRIFTILSLFVASAFAATWTVDDFIFASIAVDIAYVNETTAISAVVDPEGYAQVLWTVNDGSSWGPVYQYDGFRMYSGCAAQNNNGNQSAVVADIFAFQYANNDNMAFEGSRVPGGFKSQTVDVFGNGFEGDGVSYASVGMRWEDASNGVMVSNDQGRSFTFSNISVLRTWARYGAFPSDQVWYVTAGHWPNDNAPPLSIKQETMEFSSAISFRRGAESTTMYPHIRRRVNTPLDTDLDEIDEQVDEQVDAPENAGVIPPPGWNAQIVKTTDGGQTWVSQYWNTSYFYFNQITCQSETHCVAVGESQTKPGKGKPKVPGIHIFLTTDGEHWEEVYWQEAEWLSIFGVTFVTDEVVWACGCDLDSDPLLGFFWVSRDGGKTWKHAENVKNVYPIQMSFLDANHAWAVGPNDVQQSALLKYS